MSIERAFASTLVAGLLALAKALLLVVGVPLAALRLEAFARSEDVAQPARLALYVLIGAVGVLWLVAVAQLAGDLRATLRAPEDARRSSWSASWAGGIVGLLLLAGTIGTTAHRGRAQFRPGATPSASATSGALVAGPGTAATAQLMGALGTLAAVALLRRTRLLTRLRLSQRAPRAAAPTLDADLSELARELQRKGDDRIIDWIESLNRLLGHHFVGTGRRAPDIRLVRIGPDGIELLLGEAHDEPPPPFQSTTGGYWWVCSDPTTLNRQGQPPHDSPRLAPWLVPVGHDGRGDLLVALPPGVLLGIVGSEREVDDALRSIVASLRVLPWCDELAIELIGIEPPPLVERSVHLQQSSPATLEAIARNAHDPRSTMEDAWRREPFTVIDGRALIGLSGDRIEAHARELGGVISGREGALTLSLEPDGATLKPFGVALRPTLLARPGKSLVDRLLRTYAQPQYSVELSTSSIPEVQTDFGCEVQILGERLAFTGTVAAPHPDDLERVAELVAYLSLHARRATRASLLSDLFASGEGRASHTRLENLLAIARAMLGRSLEGEDRIRFTETSVELDPSVGTDWERLHQMVNQARLLDGERATEQLARALGELDPKTALSAAQLLPWFCAKGFDEIVRSELIDACHQLANLALATSEHRLVELALGLGTAMEPGSEIIARDAMVFAEATGRLDELDSIYRRLQSTLGELGGSEPSMATQRLYLALRSPSFDPSD